MVKSSSVKHFVKCSKFITLPDKVLTQAIVNVMINIFVFIVIGRRFHGSDYFNGM